MRKMIFLSISLLGLVTSKFEMIVNLDPLTIREKKADAVIAAII